MIANPKMYTRPKKEPSPYGRIGNLETRLAESSSEIKEAQRIRFRVFCEEMSARKDLRSRLTGREEDGHDRACDHLLVFDIETTPKKVVGTQRFMVKTSSEPGSAFHSQNQFDFEALARQHPAMNFMELGRSCILPEYRNKRTMELMWHGTWAYALQNQVDVMVGCASFPTSDLEEISPQLGFLNKQSTATKPWSVNATAKNPICMSAFDTSMDNDKQIFRQLPTLIKGYLRLGAFFASEAVPDPEFGTIDVAVILPVRNISHRYIKYYGPDAGRHSTKPTSVDGRAYRGH